MGMEVNAVFEQSKASWQARGHFQVGALACKMHERDTDVRIEWRWKFANLSKDWRSFTLWGAGHDIIVSTFMGSIVRPSGIKI